MVKRARTKKARKRPASSSMAQMSAIAMGAPFVIATRMTGMWFNALAPTPAGRKENSRMVAEKVDAATESAVAANRALARQTVKAATRVSAVTISHLQSDIEAVTRAALRPYSKRVRANTRRLSKSI